MMHVPRALLITLSLAVLWGCTGGGDGTPAAAPLPGWPKFRHDINNTGQGSGAVESNTAAKQLTFQIDDVNPSPISASPAVGLAGTIYVGSEGGTLAAINPTGEGSIKWRATDCEKGMCAGPLGALMSSPAVYTQDDVTMIFVGSSNGSLYVFQDAGTQATCTACFQPKTLDQKTLDQTIESVSFVSSPTFSVHPFTLNVTGIFIGASVQRTGTANPVGKLYAVNTDGSMQWEFPRRGAPDIAPITSSAALGIGGGLYFTTDDGLLHRLTSEGSQTSASSVGAVTDPSTPFALSPATISDAVFTANVDGEVLSFLPDAVMTLRWRVALEDQQFATSLAIGAQPELTPTATPSGIPTATPTPTGAATGTPTPGTPTPTATPFLSVSNVFGVTKSGTLVVIELRTGNLLPPTGPLPTPVAGEVASSPALSSDSFLVFGTSTGMLYAVNTATGLQPAGWPVALTSGAAIRSSPALAADGTVWVGADDGNLYGVGNQ